MRIGVLALQGAFIEHVQTLRQLGAEAVEVLAAVDEHIVAAQYGKQLALAFHPELDVAKSTAIHEYFVSLCAEK